MLNQAVGLGTGCQNVLPVGPAYRLSNESGARVGRRPGSRTTLAGGGYHGYRGYRGDTVEEQPEGSASPLGWFEPVVLGSDRATVELLC